MHTAMSDGGRRDVRISAHSITGRCMSDDLLGNRSVGTTWLLRSSQLDFIYVDNHIISPIFEWMRRLCGKQAPLPPRFDGLRAHCLHILFPDPCTTSEQPMAHTMTAHTGACTNFLPPSWATIPGLFEVTCAESSLNLYKYCALVGVASRTIQFRALARGALSRSLSTLSAAKS